MAYPCGRCRGQVTNIDYKLPKHLNEICWRIDGTTTVSGRLLTVNTTVSVHLFGEEHSTQNITGNIYWEKRNQKGLPFPIS